MENDKQRKCKWRWLWLIFIPCLCAWVQYAQPMPMMGKTIGSDEVWVTDQEDTIISTVTWANEWFIHVEKPLAKEQLQLTIIHEDGETIAKYSAWEKGEQEWISHVILPQQGKYEINMTWISEDDNSRQWQGSIYYLDPQQLIEKAESGFYREELTFSVWKIAEMEMALTMVNDTNRIPLSLTWNNEKGNASFFATGDWQLELQLFDDWGNEICYRYPEVYHMDQTGPKITIHKDQEDLISTLLPIQDQEAMITLSINDPFLSTYAVYVNDTLWQIDWQLTTDGVMGTLALTVDGSYVITIKATDLFGNESLVTSTPIRMDQSKPLVRVLLDEQMISSLPAYDQQERCLTFIVTDAYFSTTESKVIDNDQEQNVVWTMQDHEWRTTVNLGEGEHNLRLQAWDQAGHYQKWQDTITIDQTKPIVQVITEPYGSYQEKANMTFLITESNFEPNDAMVSLSCEGTQVDADITWQRITDGYLMSFTVEDEGDYQLSLAIEDQAHHHAVYEQNGIMQSTYTHDFIIDRKAPIVSFLMEDTHNGELVNHDVAIWLTVSDAHIEEQDIQVNLWHNGKTLLHEEHWVREDQHLLLPLFFQEDGDYRLEVSGKDQAGNAIAENLQTKVVRTFTIDKQAPQLTIKRSDESPYSKEALQLEISGEDSHLKVYKVFLYGNEKLVKTAQSNENGSLLFSFADMPDGQYKVVVNGVDQAGNEKQIVDTFVIDRQSPQIQTTFQSLPAQPDQLFISNQTVHVHVEWHDPYMDSETIRIRKNQEMVPIQITDHQADIVLSADKDTDDFYEIIVYGKDLAGNEKSASYQLRIDTYLPPLELVEDPFHGKAQNLTWRPALKNQDQEFHVIGTSLYRNRQLVMGYHWGDEIKEEGSYLLTLQVRDEAMNEAVLLPPFAFVIDRSMPIMRIVDDERKETVLNDQFAQGSVLRLYLEDAYSENLFVHTLSLQGEELYEADRLLDENGVWYYPLYFQKSGDYTLMIDVSDEANNHLKCQKIFHVFKNLDKDDGKAITPSASLSWKNETIPWYLVWIFGLSLSMLLWWSVKHYHVGK